MKEKIVDLTWAKDGKELSRVQCGYVILDKLNKKSDPERYGGFVSVNDLESIISFEMFRKPISVIRYERNTKAPVCVKCTTDEQDAKIKKVIAKMEMKGIIRFSKSGKMVKPNMTADEWIEKTKKEV